ncbi:Eco29kI family restriction endonuclease [Leptospira interrogans]|uniref:Eco29kI family restriction endonuclease n=1 Tax=Leptospira interrogans TaxID=173 RepID=UPI0007738FE8|nr:Eco29kI family restriction endonuclease [Leptospira interrogans]
MVDPYNPLDKKNLGESVAIALLQNEFHELPPKTFNGAGIYYKGPFEPYKPIKLSQSIEIPIYVGKAVPLGARKGGMGLSENVGDVLFKRLSDHAKSISASDNLKISDFVCKFLTVDDIWIPLGEALLIERFQPLWNIALDGFGNHDPGSGRYQQQKSIWDALHPGRTWANKLQPQSKSIKEIHRLITDHFK